MGNCLVLQNKIVKVMNIDGTVLEYKAPIKAYQILKEYPHHAISKESQFIHHVSQDVELLGDQLYYLFPLPDPQNSDVVKGGEQKGVMRIKILISKQELQTMLRKGGLGIDNMVSHHELNNQPKGVSFIDFDGDSEEKHKGWKPLLECIPEMD